MITETSGVLTGELGQKYTSLPRRSSTTCSVRARYGDPAALQGRQTPIVGWPTFTQSATAPQSKVPSVQNCVHLLL
jgi:hypothetical protein